MRELMRAAWVIGAVGGLLIAYEVDGWPAAIAWTCGCAFGFANAAAVAVRAARHGRP